MSSFRKVEQMDKFIFLILLAIISCDNYPKDPRESLRTITNGNFIVGFTHDPPGEGVEITKAFARSVNATIKWEKGSQEVLFRKLKENKIHFLLSEISKETPWKEEVALTREIKTNNDKGMIFALPPGENALLMKFEKFLFVTLGKEEK